MAQRTPQTPEDLQQHLQEQIDFLQSSANAYDQGKEIEAKRMAAIVRTLVHDTANSKSLLGQLDMKKDKFLSTCQIFQDSPVAQRGLISTFLGGDSAKYYALLDDAGVSKEMEFEDWWNEDVFIMKGQNGEKTSFSRKDIILTVANQDGGAHIDPEIEATYAKLSRHNLLGDLRGEGATWEVYKNPERATIRQITHELLKVVIQNYTKRPDIKGDGYLVGNMMLNFASAEERVHQKIGRNGPCICASGKKFKKCCGK